MSITRYAAALAVAAAVTLGLTGCTNEPTATEPAAVAAEPAAAVEQPPPAELPSIEQCVALMNDYAARAAAGTAERSFAFLRDSGCEELLVRTAEERNRQLDAAAIEQCQAKTGQTVEQCRADDADR